MGDGPLDRELTHHSQHAPDTHSQTVNSTNGIDPYPLGKRKKIFALIVLTQLVVNYDSGALAASYGDKSPRGMVQTFGLDDASKGLLASIVYPGLTVGCFLTGSLLQCVPPKWLICGSLGLNTGLCVLFAAAPVAACLFAARCAVGCTQAVIMVYGPVWVDQFAPETVKSTWMAVAMAGVPLGIVAGYLVAGFTMANFPDVSWGWPFYIQACILGPCVLLFLPVKSAYLSLPSVGAEAAEDTEYVKMAEGSMTDAKCANGSSLRRQKGAGTDHIPDLWVGIKRLLRQGLMWVSLFALCALYYVVNGLQMWVTDYLVDVIHADLNIVITAFSITAVTGPIAGVVIGGVTLDKVGGYTGHIDRAALLAAGLGACACVAAFGTLAVSGFGVFIALVWATLFFGGAVVPCLTGVIVAAVDVELRGLANALSGMTYNLCGYFLGPFVCGLVAKEKGLVWGFRAVMGTSSVAAFLAIIAYFLARRRVRDTLRGASLEYSGAAEPMLTPDTEEGREPTDARPPDTARLGVPKPTMTVSFSVGNQKMRMEMQQGARVEAGGAVVSFSAPPPGSIPKTPVPVDALGGAEAEFVLAVSFGVQQSDINAHMARRRGPVIVPRSFNPSLLSPGAVPTRTPLASGMGSRIRSAMGVGGGGGVTTLNPRTTAGATAIDSCDGAVFFHGTSAQTCGTIPLTQSIAVTAGGTGGAADSLHAQGIF